MERDPALAELLRYKGNVHAIARACGISRQAVYAWSRVPSERAQVVAEALDVPLSRVRPDLWPETVRA